MAIIVLWSEGGICRNGGGRKEEGGYGRREGNIPRL